MKFERRTYAITTLAAYCLLACGLAGWQYVGTKHLPIMMLFYTAAAMGVVWLAWYVLKLRGTITSIANLIKPQGHSNSEKDDPAGRFKMTDIGQIKKEMDERLSSRINDIDILETQVKDLQIQLQLCQRQKKNTDAIIYSIQDAVIVIDEFDKLLMANEVAGRLFGFDFSQSQHKPIETLIDKDKNEFAGFLRQCRQGRAQATRREIELTQGMNLPEDTTSPECPNINTFDCIVSCVYDDKQQICGTVAVLHDVTREKEIAQVKNDFVNHVSHELKTPLASITAYSEMLSDGEADDEQTRKEFYALIQSQADRLNRLIEGLLNTARIESGLIKVQKTPLSLVILIEEQLKMIKSYAEDKDITILEPECKDPIVFGQVYADKDMISQVIVNLLSNAVKYTPSGGSIKIETEVDELEGLTRVAITDTGVGIPADQVGHVFDKFYRVGVNNSQAKGTGLGLSLVKQIIEKVHNGRVFVKSEPNVGSTFGFELPLATAEILES